MTTTTKITSGSDQQIAWKIVAADARTSEVTFSHDGERKRVTLGDLFHASRGGDDDLSKLYRLLHRRAAAALAADRHGRVAACRHPDHAVAAVDTAFQGPVGDNENRAAHGNITRTYECRACGGSRSVNINGSHIEEGKWG